MRRNRLLESDGDSFTQHSIRNNDLALPFDQIFDIDPIRLFYVILRSMFAAVKRAGGSRQRPPFDSGTLEDWDDERSTSGPEQWREPPRMIDADRDHDIACRIVFERESVERVEDAWHNESV